MEMQVEKDKVLTEQEHGSRHFHTSTSSEAGTSVGPASTIKNRGRKRRNMKEGFAIVSLSLDMDDKAVLRILKKKLQTNTKLKCETCGVMRRSAIGFLSHLHSCGKSSQEFMQLRRPCEICGRLMLSSSLQTHMYTVHKKQQNSLKAVHKMTTKRPAAVKVAKRMQKLMEENIDLEGRGSANNAFNIEASVPKLSTRQIAHLKRALKKNGTASCRYPGCEFHTSSLEELLDHLEVCINKPKRHYACKICSFTTEEESNILNHVENEHCSQVDSDDSNSPSMSLEEEDDLIHDGPRATSKSTLHHKENRAESEVGYMCQERFRPSYIVPPCLSALKWTLEYQQQLNEQNLFPSFHTTLTDWVELSEKEAQEYLPETKESMFFVSHNHNMMEENLGNATTRCKKLALFEGDLLCGNPIFFVGGPVWSITWCPLPLQWTIETYGQINQFIAVSCHKNMESTYYKNKSYAHKGLIQIWNLGHIDNKSDGNVPKFCMGIAHEYGTVWCMEWCPSGCYDMQEKNDGTLLRIGVLAAACSDGIVHIYSVCNPTHLRSSKKNFKIFKPQPTASLVLYNKLCAKEQSWQCLCLAWHTGKGHRIIAAGFTNALIAVWSVDFDVELLKLLEQNSRIILPYKIIQTHIGEITAIAFGSLGKDPNCLLTESGDHTIKFWDLEESHNPSVVNKRGNIATYNLQLIDWMSNGLSSHCSSLHTFRGLGADVNSTVIQNHILGTVAANPWINAIAKATIDGEFSVSFVHQLLYRVDADQLKKSRRMMISHIALIELKKYNASDQHSSFNLNSSKWLEGKSLDSVDKEKTSKIFYTTTIPHEDCLIFQGKTGKYEFEIEFILEENDTVLKECVEKDTISQMPISLNTLDKDKNKFDDEVAKNGVHQSLFFQNSESMKDNGNLDTNVRIEEQHEDGTEEEAKGGENETIGNNNDTYKDYYDWKKQTEVDVISQGNLHVLFETCVTARDPSFEPHPFSESFRSSLGTCTPSCLSPGGSISNETLNLSSFQVAHEYQIRPNEEDNQLLATHGFIKSAAQVRHVSGLLGHTYDCQSQTSHTSKLSIDEFVDSPEISEDRVNEAGELLASEQDVKVSSKENCTIEEECSLGNSADVSSNLHNIMSSQPCKSAKEEYMTTDRVDRQGLQQCGTDKKAAINKPIEHDSVSHIKHLCNMFSAGANTLDVGKKSTSATDFIEQFPASQRNKRNNDIFSDTQQHFLGSYKEYNELLYKKADGSEKTADSVSDTYIPFVQKGKPETSNKNRIDESDDFSCDFESSANTHKLRFSKPEVKTYEDFTSNYGVLFCDFPKGNSSYSSTGNRSWACQSDILMPANSTVYPIFSINRTAWNPNCRSFLWLAGGYQCGFVRIFCVSAAHTHMMDDIFRNAARNMEHK